MGEYFIATEAIYELFKKEIVVPVEENETLKEDLPIKT